MHEWKYCVGVSFISLQYLNCIEKINCFSFTQILGGRNYFCPRALSLQLNQNEPVRRLASETTVLAELSTTLDVLCSYKLLHWVYSTYTIITIIWCEQWYCTDH